MVEHILVWVFWTDNCVCYCCNWFLTIQILFTLCRGKRFSALFASNSSWWAAILCYSASLFSSPPLFCLLSLSFNNWSLVWYFMGYLVSFPFYPFSLFPLPHIFANSHCRQKVYLFLRHKVLIMRYAINKPIAISAQPIQPRNISLHFTTSLLINAVRY